MDVDDASRIHAAEVIGARLFLFGGIGGGSPGTVQIFDPLAAPGSQWSRGADFPAGRCPGPPPQAQFRRRACDSLSARGSGLWEHKSRTPTTVP